MYTIEPDTLKMPLYRFYPNGLRKGVEVTLEGFIPHQSKGFHVDFLRGQYNGADIPFKFNLHFEGPPHSSTTVVTLTSFVKGKWRKEGPFLSTSQRGRSFMIRIMITNSGFKIIENDQLLAEFPHQTEPKNIYVLVMDGEIELKRLYLPSK